VLAVVDKQCFVVAYWPWWTSSALLVEELVSRGELFDHITELGHLSISQAVRLIHQVFDGIQYLYTNGDLKPENLLVVSRDCVSLIPSCYGYCMRPKLVVLKDLS
jgi:serine/threonine protein kinase